MSHKHSDQISRYTCLPHNQSHNNDKTALFELILFCGRKSTKIVTKIGTWKAYFCNTSILQIVKHFFPLTIGESACKAFLYFFCVNASLMFSLVLITTLSTVSDARVQTVAI